MKPTRREAMLSAAAAAIPAGCTVESLDETAAALIIKHPARASRNEREHAHAVAKEVANDLNIGVIVMPASWKTEIVSQQQLKEMRKTGIS